MTPHKQLFQHDPPETFGDCFRTCIACILNERPEDVPHFAADVSGDPDKMSESVRRWLAGYGIGYTLTTIAFDCETDELLAMMEHKNRGHWILTAKSSRSGVGHCVVCAGGKIVHDPAIDASPDDAFSRLEGYLWAEFITVL